MSDDELHLPITRCPHCKTAFRVRESQLTLRHGMVRCGACRGVFNAIQHLLHQRGNTITIMPAPGDHVPEGYVSAPAQLGPLTLMPEEIRAAAIPPIAHAPIAVEPSADQTAIERAIVSPTQGPALKTPVVESVADLPPIAVQSGATSPTPLPQAAPIADQTASAEAPTEQIPPIAATAAPPPITANANNLVEHEIYTDVLEAKLAGMGRPPDAIDRFEWKPKRGASPAWMRALWTLVALALSALLVAQAGIIFRNDLAVRVPALRVPLTQVCDKLGCKVAAPVRENFIVIDGAEFQADASHTGLYIFSATLKNKHELAAAYPHLVITLTGLNNQILSRRIFAPQEFVPGNADLKSGLSGQGEVEFKLWIDASTISPVGFDVRTTYAPAS